MRTGPMDAGVGDAVEVLAGGEIGGKERRALVPKGMLELGIVVSRWAVHGMCKMWLFSIRLGWGRLHWSEWMTGGTPKTLGRQAASCRQLTDKTQDQLIVSKVIR